MVIDRPIEQTVAEILGAYQVAILKALSSGDKISVKNLVEILKETAPHIWDFTKEMPQHLHRDLQGLTNCGFICYETEGGQNITQLNDNPFVVVDPERMYISLHPFGAALIPYLK